MQKSAQCVVEERCDGVGDEVISFVRHKRVC